MDNHTHTMLWYVMTTSFSYDIVWIKFSRIRYLHVFLSFLRENKISTSISLTIDSTLLVLLFQLPDIAIYIPGGSSPQGRSWGQRDRQNRFQGDFVIARLECPLGLHNISHNENVFIKCLNMVKNSLVI